jgi:hypothetical protein
MRRFNAAERDFIAETLVGITESIEERAKIHGIPVEVDEVTLAEARLVVDKVLDIAESLREVRDDLDAQGIPTAACPNCGEQWLNVPMIFDDETYDVAAWATEGECYSCGTRVTVCTPKDSMKEVEEP